MQIYVIQQWSRIGNIMKWPCTPTVMFLQEIILHISTVCFVKYDHCTFLINHAYVILKDIQFRSRIFNYYCLSVDFVVILAFGDYFLFNLFIFLGFCAMLAICAEALWMNCPLVMALKFFIQSSFIVCTCVGFTELGVFDFWTVNWYGWDLRVVMLPWR